jgi:hypothetical protein
MEGNPVADEKVKDFVKRNAIIYCFAFLLVILAGFQVRLYGNTKFIVAQLNIFQIM